MGVKSNHLIIKGVKDGLVFILDDQCDFSILLQELEHKLSKTHQQILTGPIIHVDIQTGRRLLTNSEKKSMTNAIRKHGNLIIRSMKGDQEEDQVETESKESIKLMKGMLRSGQTVVHDGSILLLGDVNPGGTVVCTGNVYIMGSLRGIAHAGSDGDHSKIIAASYLCPTQLRIADIISRSPDEWATDETMMEFAYIKDGKMEIDKIHRLHLFDNIRF